MPRASTGYGANYGDNYGGGGLVRLSGFNPAPFGTISISNTFRLTVGVHGSLIDISKVVITVGGEPAFSGGAFGGAFLGSSSYSYNPSENGYDFVVVRTGGYVVSPVQVMTVAETRDGAASTQSYQLFANLPFVPPEIPKGVPLGFVSLDEFSGEGGPDVISGGQGLAFFSPALTPRAGSQVDFVDFEVETDAGDHYVVKQTSNRRPWLWGPPPAVPPVSPPAFPPTYEAVQYEPHFNRGFCFLKTTQRSAYGVMTDTITTESTVILY